MLHKRSNFCPSAMVEGHWAGTTTVLSFPFPALRKIFITLIHEYSMCFPLGNWRFTQSPFILLRTLSRSNSVARPGAFIYKQLSTWSQSELASGFIVSGPIQKAVVFHHVLTLTFFCPVLRIRKPVIDHPFIEVWRLFFLQIYI